MKERDRNSNQEQLACIDRDAYEPAYVQLVNILRRQVAAGVFHPGDRLPSEAQLCDRYQVSPITVRRAINILSDQGVVSTAQGRGTFVRSLELVAATFHLRELQSFFSDEEHTTVKLLEARIVSAVERIARKLGIAAGERAIYIRRLLSLDGEPAVYHRQYLLYDPARPVVEAEMEVTSLRGLFEGTAGMALKRGELTIEATVMNEEDARLLQAPMPAAAFCLEHIFFDFDDRPVSWGWFICRGDRLRFATTIGVHDTA